MQLPYPDPYSGEKQIPHGLEQNEETMQTVRARQVIQSEICRQQGLAAAAMLHPSKKQGPVVHPRAGSVVKFFMNKTDRAPMKRNEAQNIVAVVARRGPNYSYWLTVNAGCLKSPMMANSFEVLPHAPTYFQLEQAVEWAKDIDAAPEISLAGAFEAMDTFYTAKSIAVKRLSTKSCKCKNAMCGGKCGCNKAGIGCSGNCSCRGNCGNNNPVSSKTKYSGLDGTSGISAM